MHSTRRIISWHLFTFLGHHVFGWRDFFDIYTRWRQVEPNYTPVISLISSSIDITILSSTRSDYHSHLKVSEPKDLVWWVDKLSIDVEFDKRVGLSTYITRGVNKVKRYYPYYKQAFNISKFIMTKIGFHDPK
jgi:hypothetical protein